ncbi:hypothetical protein ACUXV3_12215 [Roseobacteraceae bacterium NS-SX3]
MKRPDFNDLPEKLRANFGNGLGPHWMPEQARLFLTRNASWFFTTASWRHHDFGYAVGGDEWDRARCDWKFLRAMLADAISQEPAGDDWVWAPEDFLKAAAAILISLVFFTAVRLGGQFGSFKYRDRYATLEEIMASCR